MNYSGVHKLLNQPSLTKSTTLFTPPQPINHIPLLHTLSLPFYTNQGKKTAKILTSIFTRLFGTSSTSPAIMSAAKVKAEGLIKENAVGAFTLPTWPDMIFLLHGFDMIYLIYLFLSICLK